MTQALVKQEPTVLSCIGSDVWKEEVQKVIPKEIALEAMLRVGRSVASDPKFANVDPKSFLLALLKCSRAGLYPDGREAHLIAFGREVQAIFDVKGICALAGRAGILVTPKIVLEKDEFEVQEDDGAGKTKVTHRADYRKPRGEIQVVYSRAVMPNGAVDYEIMSADEVEHVRQTFSRAKDSTPWKNSWGEMAKKTVIKRHSKRWDMSPELRQALNADDDSLPDPKELKTSVPIFTSAPAELQPATEVEVVVEPPDMELRAAALRKAKELFPEKFDAKAPPVSAAPPVVPVPKPRPAKSPTASPTPVKPTQEHKEPTILSVVQSRMAAKGVTIAKMIALLVELGTISETTQTLEEVAIESPDVLDMVYRQLDDLCEKIKST